MFAEQDEPRQPDRYYSPSRLRALLVLYPYLAESKPPSDPDLQMSTRQAFGPGGWQEEALAKRGDIARALAWLAERDERAAYVVRAHYCVGLPHAAIADYLRREYGMTRSGETIRRWTIDAVEMMSAYLGYGLHNDNP